MGVSHPDPLARLVSRPLRAHARLPYTALALHYYAINIAATLATAWLLIARLRTFVTSQPIRPIVVALFLLECSIAWS